MKKNLWENRISAKPALTEADWYLQRQKSIISPTTSEILFSGQRTREGGRGNCPSKWERQQPSKSAGERTMASWWESVLSRLVSDPHLLHTNPSLFLCIFFPFLSLFFLPSRPIHYYCHLMWVFFKPWCICSNYL